MKVLSFPDVSAKTSLGRTAIYRHIANQAFPRPIKIGRRSGWVESEIDEWVAGRIAERDAKPARQ